MCVTKIRELPEGWEDRKGELNLITDKYKRGEINEWEYNQALKKLFNEGK